MNVFIGGVRIARHKNTKLLGSNSVNFRPSRGVALLGLLMLSVYSFPVICQIKAAQPIEVKYLPPSPSPDRQNYEAEVIRAALDATTKRYGPYKFTVWDGENMNMLRGVREIVLGNIVNVATNPLSGELLSEEIKVIPIPLMKGLLGYRAIIVRKEDVERLSAIKDINSLRKLKLGQLDYWSDIAVYEANNFEVVKGATIDVLFSMLTRERFDYIPLGVGEVENIFANYKGQYPELTILPTSYIYYPFPVYAYVSRSDAALATRLVAGLETISKNGKLEQLFRKQFGDAFNRINARNSRIIRIENTLIPQELLPKIR